MPALHFGSRRRTKASTLLWYAAALVAAVTIDASYGYASEDAKMVANLSPWAMFMAADMVVKGVMTSLAVASVLVWGAWMGKLIQVSLTKMRVTRDVRRLMEADSLEIASDAFGGRRDAIAIMVQSAVGELVRSDRARLPASGIKERVSSHLARIEAAGGRAMARGTSLIATVGATAPFVGLFGTVWGIMNSFIGISKAQTTNLAVVAPGIAEALLATAIGLVAAIPAVIFYNQLARTISGYKALLADASAAIERLVSRDLDRLKGGEAVRVAAAAE